MIEQKLEKIVLDKMKDALEAANVSGFQIVGIWQSSDDKGVEDGESEFVIGVKSFPRSYDTPTIPDANITIQVSLAMRSDVDYSGSNYLKVTSLISDILQKWQNKFNEGEDDFSISGEFNYTGFSLGGGDCGIDKENCVWQFSQTMTIYGTIL